MTNKKIFWINLAFYLLFPLAGLILWLIALIVGGDNLKNEEYYSLVFFELFTLAVGLLYHLAYEQFESREKLQKLFRFLAYILNVAGNGFYAFLAVAVLTKGNSYPLLHTSFGNSFGFAGLFVSPLFAVLRPVASRYETKYEWSDGVKLIVTLALPFACYIIGVLFFVSSFAICFAVLAVVAFIVKIRMQGKIVVCNSRREYKVTLYQKTLFHVVFYVALFTFFLLVYKHYGLNTMDEIALLPFIAAFSFLFFLAYDFFETLYYAIPKKLGVLKKLCILFDGIFGKICCIVGVLLSVVAAFFALHSFAGAGFEGLSKTLRCDFKNALRYGLFMLPAFYALTRWCFYKLATKNDWSELKKIIFTVIYPIPCYILAVLALLIGVYYVALAAPILSYVAVLITITYGEKSKGFQKYLDEIPYPYWTAVALDPNGEPLGFDSFGRFDIRYHRDFDESIPANVERGTALLSGKIQIIDFDYSADDLADYFYEKIVDAKKRYEKKKQKKQKDFKFLLDIKTIAEAQFITYE